MRTEIQRMTEDPQFKERLEALWNFGLKPGSAGTDEGEANTTGVQGERTVQSVIRGALPMLKRAALLSVFVNLVALFPAVFSLQVYDRVIYRGGLNTLVALLIGMAILMAADLILRSFRARVLRVAAVKIDGQIASDLMTKYVNIMKSGGITHAITAKKPAVAAPLAVKGPVTVLQIK